jgi:hypothetical protein
MQCGRQGHTLHGSVQLRRSKRTTIALASLHPQPAPEAVASASSAPGVPRSRSVLYELAVAAQADGAAAAPPGASSLAPFAVAGGVALALLALKRVYDTPSRSYNNNVGDEYDAWTDEGILEHYWGEHIHLGYYTEEERARGWWTADFKAAKLRFTQEMFRFSGAVTPKRILDVGCGFGGSSRWLAAQFPDAEVVGACVRASVGCMRGGWCGRVQAGLACVECRQVGGAVQSSCPCQPQTSARHHTTPSQASHCRPSKWRAARSWPRSGASPTSRSRCVLCACLCVGLPRVGVLDAALARAPGPGTHTHAHTHTRTHAHTHACTVLALSWRACAGDGRAGHGVP